MPPAGGPTSLAPSPCLCAHNGSTFPIANIKQMLQVWQGIVAVASISGTFADGWL